MNRQAPARVVSFLALLAIVVSGLYLVQSQGGSEDLEARWFSRFTTLDFADRLRQTSDDLTRMVRLHAVTGDPVYRTWFDEILAIRNGEMPRPLHYYSVPYWDIVLNTGEHFGERGPAVPIRRLAQDAGLLEDELALLARAEDASNELAALETEVMEVVAAQGGDHALQGEALQAMLRLHGPDYFAAKAQVMVPLVDLHSLHTANFMEWRLNEWQPQASGIFRQNLIITSVLLTLTIVLIAADFWMNRRRLPDAGPRRVLNALASLLALLAVLLTFSFPLRVASDLASYSGSGFLEERLEARDLADNLRQTSDDLTLMARLHAITGDPLYREYFDEILDIRNGVAPRPANYFGVPYWDIVLDSGDRGGEAGEAVAMRTLMSEVGLRDDEMAELVQSEDASNALTELEYEVMDVVAAQIEAGAGEYVLEGEALQAMLRLHGPEYHAAKALVMHPLVELERKIVEAGGSAARDNIGSLDQSAGQMIPVLAAAFVFLAAGIWLRRREA